MNATETSVHIVLKGLEPAAQYALSATSGGLDNQTVGGVALMGVGLTVSLPKIYSSDLVIVVKQGRA
jgi:hypothetical protein